MARKPLSEKTVAANVLRWGTGALNIDGGRVFTGDRLVHPFIKRDDNDILGKGLGAGVRDEPDGRWPPNVILSPEAAEEMDRQSGTSKSKSSTGRQTPKNGTASLGNFEGTDNIAGHDDEGGASRFFPVFKYQAKAPESERPVIEGEPGHPTVKPLALMRWLSKLVTRPGGRVLDPFAGTGTTAEAGELEFLDVMLIERDPVSVRRVHKRMEKYPASLLKEVTG
jgi:site-specific DNA-methyltransferase (adenine-specific)